MPLSIDLADITIPTDEAGAERLHTQIHAAIVSVLPPALTASDDCVGLGPVTVTVGQTGHGAARVGWNADWDCPPVLTGGLYYVGALIAETSQWAAWWHAGWDAARVLGPIGEGKPALERAVRVGVERLCEEALVSVIGADLSDDIGNACDLGLPMRVRDDRSPSSVSGVAGVVGRQSRGYRTRCEL